MTELAPKPRSRSFPWWALWLAGLAALPVIWIWADPLTPLAQQRLMESPTITAIVWVGGAFGKFSLQAITILLCLPLVWLRAGRRKALTWLALTAICLMATAVAVNVTKVTTGRERPAYVNDRTPAEGALGDIASGKRMSFPSGDVTSVFAIGMAALFIAPRAAAAVFVLGVVVSVARIYAGMHHFADVWGGMLMATAVSGWVLRRFRLREAAQAATRPPEDLPEGGKPA